jgi:hypothetical protein
MKAKALKLISLVLCFSINLFQTGCITSKQISLSDFSKSYETSYLILHTPEKKFLVKDYVVIENHLKGDLFEYSGSGKNCLNAYTYVMLDIKNIPESERKLNLETSSIYKALYIKSDAGKTILLVLGVIASVFLLGGVAVNNMTFDVM